MNETLQEYVDSRGANLRIDREAGVIRGVKILGLESRNGRVYLPEALAQAAGLYEEAKVNVNHGKGDPLAPRDYQDRIGVIRGVAVRPEGLFGEFHFNPKHALAEQLLWDAEHAAENVGFSHNVQARTARRGDRVVVEAITRVQSVDLVADPATTRGLFESLSGNCPEFRVAKMGLSPSGPALEPPSEPPLDLARLTLDDLKTHRADLVETILQQRDPELASLREEIERREAAEASRRRRAMIERLLEEAGLPKPDADDEWTRAVVGRQFVDSLLAAADEAAVRALVEERARLVRCAAEPPAGRGGVRPISREQGRAEASIPLDARAFVESIT